MREVNDSIAELGERFGLREETLELMCECGQTACAERLTVPAADYERLRASDRRIVARGHDYGHPAEPHEGYAVVD